MPETIKSPSQALPAAGVLSDLYTVPSATAAVISSITCCNQGAAPARVWISVAPGGPADAAAQYLRFAKPIPPSETWTDTIGITMAATDVLRVKSDTGSVSFSAFKAERS